jgi:hypothetical protein
MPLAEQGADRGLKTICWLAHYAQNLFRQVLEMFVRPAIAD